MTYVTHIGPEQLWCTHKFCVDNTPKCHEAMPDQPWRLCTLFKGHEDKHYVPPITVPYHYW